MFKKFLLQFLLLSAFVTGSAIFTVNAENPEKQSSAVEKQTAVSNKSGKKQKKTVSYKWHQGNLDRHFIKHGSEFPEFKSSKEYGDAAVKFFTEPPKGTEFKRRPNGDRLCYHEKSNFFAVATKDGFIKTFFRPNKGKKYWKRQ